MGNRYDHRLRNAIVESGDKDLFRDLNIPKSTIRDWLRKGKVKVITHQALSFTNEDLIFENQMLRQEIEHEKAKANLITKSVNVMGFQVQYLRLPTSEAKSRLIEIIQSASKAIPIKECLDAIKLSAARYRSWLIRQRKCQLDEYSSCPKLNANKLLTKEISKIIDLVTNQKFRHFSISSLSIYAKRNAEVFASASTWYRIIKQFKLQRPGKRYYPPKPKVGIRASNPG